MHAVYAYITVSLELAKWAFCVLVCTTGVGIYDAEVNIRKSFALPVAK